MTELEKYISSNLEAFDSEPMPEGSKARFMDAVGEERRKRRVKITRLAFTGIAAACAALMVFHAKPDISRELKRHHTRLAEKEAEILILAEKEYPYDADAIMSTVRSITAEAIPLEDQLPDEMSMKDKSRILNEYYNYKINALEEVMALYTESL